MDDPIEVFEVTLDKLSYGYADSLDDLSRMLESYFGDSDEWRDMAEIDGRVRICIAVTLMEREEFDALEYLEE